MVAKVDAFHPKWNFEYHLLGLQRLQTINPPKCYLLHPSGARCFASKTGQDHLRTKCSRVTCGTCHSEKRLEISSEGVTLDKMDGNNWNNLRTKKHVDLRNGTTKANRPDPEKKKLPKVFKLKWPKRYQEISCVYNAGGSMIVDGTCPSREMARQLQRWSVAVGCLPAWCHWTPRHGEGKLRVQNKQLNDLAILSNWQLTWLRKTKLMPSCCWPNF